MTPRPAPASITPAVLDHVFHSARTVNKFTTQPVDDAQLRALYDLCKWAPTSMNSQPMRLVFVTSAEAKEKLRPALSPGNVDKTMAAPVTAIVAIDTAFYEHLPMQMPSIATARATFADNAELARTTAFRNGSMQGGYLILAARMLGLDAGPMSGFDIAKVDEAFFAGTTFTANFLVNLGYGDASANYPRAPRLSFEEAARIV